MSVPDFSRDEITISPAELNDQVIALMDASNRDQAWIRTGLIAFLYAILGIVNYATFEAAIGLAAMYYALFITVTFGAITLMHRYIEYPAMLTNAALFVELSILQADAIAFHELTDGAMSGFGVYLLIVGAGLFMTRTRWIVASILMVTSSWMFTVWYLNSEVQLSREVLMTISAVLAASFFFAVRVRSAYRLGRHQLLENKYRDTLEDALAHIETLSGLLPICANCKSIRGEDNEWSRIEEYVSERSDVEFTHSVCPTCRDELYPEFAER